MTSRRGNYYVMQVLASMHQLCRFLSEAERSWTPPRARASDRSVSTSARFAYRLCRDGFNANDAHRQT